MIKQARNQCIIFMSEALFSNLNPDYVTYQKEIKYRTQVGVCIAEGLKKRGYTRSEDDWDLYWVEKECLESFYSNNRVTRDKKINHFRTFYEICRKDNLNRNLKKYRRNLEKEGKTKQAAEYNFTPLSFVLPLEMPSFVEQFKKISALTKSSVWIMKPTAKSQGKGIFLLNKLSAIQQWAQNPEAQNYICQKYISNPLLIGHKKFDLRLYVLCTSYRPLTAYLYRQGFARFTHYRYDHTNISENEIHLTNVAIQKNTSEYSKNLGGKWMLSQLKNYLISKYGLEPINLCFFQIKNIIVRTLKSVSKLMSNEENCFELYGFDIMLDDTLKPWLIEVNGSPSMRANTKKDKNLKVGIVDDMMTVVDLEKILSGSEEVLGGFDLICRKDNNYEHQFFSMVKMCMLGCKLDRNKNYRALASTLNNFHRKNYEGANRGGKNESTGQQKIVCSPSPDRKSFTVRKQKIASGLQKQPSKAQTLAQTQISTQTNRSLTDGKTGCKQSIKQGHEIFNKVKIVKSNNLISLQACDRGGQSSRISYTQFRRKVERI